jgi:hypothetical protein
MKTLILSLLLAALVGCGGTIETGAGGAAGTTSAASAMTTSSSGMSASTTTSSSSGGCPCSLGFTCCNGVCVNTANDIHNCGACNVGCMGVPPFCDQGKCGSPPCSGPACSPGGFCCGAACCNAGELCCDVQGPGPTQGPKCTPPENGTCPKGCPACQ